MGQYFFCIKCLFILNVKWEYIVKPRIFKHSTRKILETSSFCSGDYDGTEQACSSQWGQAKDEKEGWEGQCSPWKAWESLRSPHPSLTRGAGLSPAPQLLRLLLGSGSHLPNLHFTASFSPHIWDRIHLSLQTAQPSNIADFLTPFSGIITRSFSISHAPALPAPAPKVDFISGLWPSAPPVWCEGRSPGPRLQLRSPCPDCESLLTLAQNRPVALGKWRDWIFTGISYILYFIRNFHISFCLWSIWLSESLLMHSSHTHPSPISFQHAHFPTFESFCTTSDPL